MVLLFCPPLLLVLLVVVLTSAIGQELPRGYLRHTAHASLSSNQTTVTTAIPLHSSSGTHHAYVWIGQPPQRQALIVDTGSRLTATVCQPCRNCGHHANAPLIIQESTTVRISNCSECRMPQSVCTRRGKCQFSQKYTEGSSWTAIEMNDVLVLGSDSEDELDRFWQLTVTFTFGCQNSIRGLFQQQYADGILGLLRSDHSLVSALADQRVLHKRGFSLCTTPEGGYMGLGAPLWQYHVEEMQYTPISRQHGWYSVHVENLYLGEVLITDTFDLIASFADGKGTILDSGTTDTYLPASLRQRLSKVWEEMTNIPYIQRSYAYTFTEFQSLPVVTFELMGGIRLEMQPIYYMENALTVPWNGTRVLINRLYATEPAGAVLGLNAMMGYDIYHEDEGEGRIGIAKASCSNPVTNENHRQGTE